MLSVKNIPYQPADPRRLLAYELRHNIVHQLRLTNIAHIPHSPDEFYGALYSIEGAYISISLPNLAD